MKISKIKVLKGPNYWSAIQHKLYEDERFGPSTGSIIEEAVRRQIPCIKLDNDSLVQLGYGKNQKRIEATIASTTSCIAMEIAGDKRDTKNLLKSANIPVPDGAIVYNEEELRAVIDDIKFPVVLKPVDGNHGKGATINITNWFDALKALSIAKEYSTRVICEKYISGSDFRVLVINNKFIAAALRTPAMVTGDGKRTIQQLIDNANKDPRRGNGHQKILTLISVDEATREILQKKNLTLESVLPKGQELWLKETANLSTGGTATDLTDEVHPLNVKLFERIARTIGLDICGIDIMAPNLSSPVLENGGAVIEVNAAPGFRMHLQPTHGQPRNVAKPVLEMLFPGKNCRIPIVAITGTNGKTTTTRLIAAITKAAGYNVGFTTTEGVYIDDAMVMKGDCSGPASAQIVLKDPLVDFAVLETARGGILRSGLGFDLCNVGVITNIAEDHLGLQGINTLQQLAKVKSVVAKSVMPNGYAVLNADDDLVYAMRDVVDCKIALFSLNADSQRIKSHCAKGGLGAIYEEGFITLRKGTHSIRVEEVTNIPITFSGKAEFNIANVLAATLAAFTSDINVNVIAEALRSFAPSMESTPGRLNIIDFKDFSVMIDYAHNPHGLKALGKFLKSIDSPVKVGVIAGVGDRRDEDIIAFAEEAARVFDEIIIRQDEDLRGRTENEICSLLKKGLNNVDSKVPVECFSDEIDSVKYVLENAKANSFITILSDNISNVYNLLLQHQNKNQPSHNNINQVV